MKMELNNTRKFKIIYVLLIIIFCLFLISCKDKEKEKTKPNDDKTYDNTIFPEKLKGAIKDKKVYITSIGQSQDMIEYKEVVLDHTNYFEYEMDSLLSASKVEEGSCVLLFVGCSIKALAASELTIDDELSRAKDYVELAKSKKITLICFHIGGLARRGATSDQFIKALFPYSNMNIYLDSGNGDKLLSSLSNDNNIPCFEISSKLALDKTTAILCGKEE